MGKAGSRLLARAGRGPLGLPEPNKIMRLKNFTVCADKHCFAPYIKKKKKRTQLVWNKHHTLNSVEESFPLISKILVTLSDLRKRQFQTQPHK